MRSKHHRQSSSTGGGSSPNGRWAGFTHLLMARMKELKREPEVVFWVFVFPILLALGLGIAFRNKPADVTSIAIVPGPGTENVLAMIQHSPRSTSIRARRWMSRLHCRDCGWASSTWWCCRMEKAGLSIATIRRGRRACCRMPRWMMSCRRPPGGRIRCRPTTVASREPGSRYIDFLIPGLLGMNLMNSGMWGIGFSLVDMRQRKLLKRFVGTPMRRSDFLLALISSRLVLMMMEVGLLLGFGVIFFHMRVLGSILPFCCSERSGRCRLEGWVC